MLVAMPWPSSAPAAQANTAHVLTSSRHFNTREKQPLAPGFVRRSQKRTPWAGDATVDEGAGHQLKRVHTVSLFFTSSNQIVLLSSSQTHS